MTKSATPTLKPFFTTSSILSLLKYVFASLLFFIPLYPKFPLFNIPGTYVAIRAEDFLIVVLSVLFGLYLKDRTHRQHLLSHPLTKPIALFWLVGLVSALSGAFLTQTAPPHLALLHWARRIEYMIPFFVALFLAKDEKILIFFSKIILPVAAAVFGYGIAQIYFNAPVISTQNEEFSKGFALTLQPGVNLSSTFAGHYDLAIYLLITLSLGLALLFTYKNLFLKILHISLLLALFWLLLQTGSRIAFFATLGTTSLILIFKRLPQYVLVIALLGAVGLANTPSLAGRFGSLLDVFRIKTIQEKVKGVFDSRQSLVTVAFAAETSPTPYHEPAAPEINASIPLRPIQQDRSTSIRFDVEWPRAVRAFYKNPFLGTGYSSITLATDNDYLRALGETGLLGFLSFMAVLLSLAAQFIKAIKVKVTNLSHHFNLGFFSAFLGLLLVAVFIDLFEASKIAILFWMYAGLAIGSINTKK